MGAEATLFPPAGVAMSAATERDATATTFLREHRGLLYRVAASYEAEASRRDDLLQEIALAIWRASGSFRGEASFKTFALRVAHNRAATWSARESRQRQREATVAAEPSAPPGTAETLVQQDALLAAVRALPLGQRQVLSLAFEGLSYEEIASVLELTVSNVGVRLNRARHRLGELLDG